MYLCMYVCIYVCAPKTEYIEKEEEKAKCTTTNTTHTHTHTHTHTQMMGKFVQERIPHQLGHCLLLRSS